MFIASEFFVEKLQEFKLLKYWIGKEGIYELFVDEYGQTYKVFHKFQSSKVYCIL